MRSFKALAIPSLLLIASSATHATTILIDATTRNGNFEVTAAGGINDGDRTFADTADWTNTNGAQTAQATRNTPANLDSTGDYTGASGGYNAVVSEGAGQYFSNETGHTVAAGDVYDATLYWIDAFGWTDTADQIALEFFTTVDDTIGGTVEDVLQFLSGVSSTDATYQEFSVTGTSLPAAFEGDALFVRFLPVNGNATNGFARVDDFSLSVTPVPEPSSLLLVALGALPFVRRRR